MLQSYWTTIFFFNQNLKVSHGNNLALQNQTNLAFYLFLKCVISTLINIFVQIEQYCLAIVWCVVLVKVLNESIKQKQKYLTNFEINKWPQQWITKVFGFEMFLWFNSILKASNINYGWNKLFIVKILNIDTMLLCTHSYYFFPVSIHSRNVFHCLLQVKTIDILDLERM